MRGDAQVGQMYKVVVRKYKGYKTVQTYAENLKEAIEKVSRCERYKVDVVQTRKLYESEE